MVAWQVWYYALALALNSMHVAVHSSSDRELIFGLMTRDQGIEAGVQDAVSDINRRNDLLSGYQLRFIPTSVESMVTNSIVV